MSGALKQPTVVVLLPHELAAVVNKLREIKAFDDKHLGPEPLNGDELKRVFALAMDVVAAASTAFHHAITAEEPENVMVVLGAPLYIHDGTHSANA